MGCPTGCGRSFGRPGGSIQQAEHRPAPPAQGVVGAASDVLGTGCQLERHLGWLLYPGPLGGRAEEVGDDEAARRVEPADQPAGAATITQGNLEEAALLVGQAAADNHRVEPAGRADLLAGRRWAGELLAQPVQHGPPVAVQVAAFPAGKVAALVDDGQRLGLDLLVQPAELPLDLGQGQPDQRAAIPGVVLNDIGELVRDLLLGGLVVQPFLQRQPVVPPHVAGGVVGEDPCSPGAHA